MQDTTHPTPRAAEFEQSFWERLLPTRHTAVCPRCNGPRCLANLLIIRKVKRGGDRYVRCQYHGIQAVLHPYDQVVLDARQIGASR